MDLPTIHPQVQSCFFHWRKALRDNLKKRGAEKVLSTNKSFNVIYRMCVGLAFVPADRTIEVFHVTIGRYIETTELPAECHQWIQYFVKTYIGSTEPRLTE